MRLLVQNGFRSVDVLGRDPVVIGEPACSEAQGLPPRVADRPQRTPLEEVPAGFSSQTGRHELYVAETAATEMPHQRAAVSRRETNLKPLRCLTVEASVGQQLPSDDSLRTCELLRIELSSESESFRQPDTRSRRHPRA